MERALALAEIIECIVSFLNDYNLRKALLVNKTWRAIALPYRGRHLLWHDSLDADSPLRKHILQQLAVCRSLTFSTQSAALSREQSESWANLLEGLQARDSLETRSRRAGLATLTIHSAVCVTGKLMPLLRSRSIARTLTTLTIDRTDNGIFPIEPILAQVPMLVQLSLGPGPLGMHQNLGALLCPNAKRNVVAPRLQSLLLRRLKYVPGDMANLFAMMPNLVELRAIDMARTIRRPSVATVQDASSSSSTFTSSTDSSSQDAPLFVLAEHCPRIKTLVFTDRISGSPPMDLATLFKACPNVDSWGLSAWDISPTTFSTILALPNVLTSLEIWHGSQLRSGGPLLHAFLCLSPMLQHLRAPEYRFPISCFDTDQQQPKESEEGDGASSTKRLSPRPKIWNCRNLKTLHLGFVYQTTMTTQENNKTARKMGRLEQSRLVFKYLAKVCPQLRDVYIWKDDLSIDLEGGLCFLLRLQQLETLRFRTNDMPSLTERDLCWIANETSLLPPSVAAERDEEEEEEEKEEEKEEQVPLWATEPSPDLDRTKTERADRRVGWKEVEASLDTHVWSKYPTWPMLESFRIECPGNYSHLDILRKYRPEVERFAGEKPFLQWDE
ncbi:hypothetical protein MVEG_06295 [Podila verticillata NRRL 6337]|nr:hypothetical protein MVEG_06295 [Podila verticillata NRRL 6337]